MTGKMTDSHTNHDTNGCTGASKDFDQNESAGMNCESYLQAYLECLRAVPVDPPARPPHGGLLATTAAEAGSSRKKRKKRDRRGIIDGVCGGASFLGGRGMPEPEEKVTRELTASPARSLSSGCIAQGWLMKQGQVNHSASGWRRRWVVLVTHRDTRTVGGRQLVWYEDADAPSANGVVQLFAPQSVRPDPVCVGDARRDVGAAGQLTKNYKVKWQRKTGVSIGLPHCFRVELLHDGTRLVLAADTAALADWWRHAIDSGVASIPQPPQPTVLSLESVGMLWNTQVDLLLCEDALLVRQLGEREKVFQYEAVKAIKCRSGSEIALWAKPDHDKHPVLLSGQNAKHAQRVVAEVDSHLNEYAQKTAIPWMIERMKQKEADAAACAEERGETQPKPLDAEPEPESESTGPPLLTLESSLAGSPGGHQRSSSSTGIEGLAGAAHAKILLRTLSRERALIGDAHQRKWHRSTPVGRSDKDSGLLTTLEEMESEFDWMPEGWRTHYRSTGAENTTISEDEVPTLEPAVTRASVAHMWTSSVPEPEPEPELEPEPEPEQSESELEGDSNSAPPASPTLGMPPDTSAPRPSNGPTAQQETTAARDGTNVDESHEHYSEFMTLARKGSQTTCARMFKTNTGGMQVTISKFCEEIKRRAERHSHHKAPSEEAVTDCSTILRDVSAFLEAMCANVVVTHRQDLHDAVQLALKLRAPLRLDPGGIDAAIQMGVEWYIGGVVYSMLQKVLLKTAGSTRTRPGATAAENDARLLVQRDLLGGKPQRFLEIDPHLISRSEWQKPCATLSKINSATINGAMIPSSAKCTCWAFNTASLI